MEGKVANATKGAAFGKRFRDKMTAREIWDSAPKLAVQESVLQPGLKTRCVEREKGRSGKHVRAPQRKAKVAHGPRRCARAAPRSISPGQRHRLSGPDHHPEARWRMGAAAVRHALAAGTLLWRAAVPFACPFAACALQNAPSGPALRFDAGSPRRGPQCAHPAITNGPTIRGPPSQDSTKKAPGLGGGRAHDTRS